MKQAMTLTLPQDEMLLVFGFTVLGSCIASGNSQLSMETLEILHKEIETMGHDKYMAFKLKLLRLGLEGREAAEREKAGV